MAWTETWTHEKPPYKITKDDFDALLYTTEKQIDALKKERDTLKLDIEKAKVAKIHKEAIRLSLKTLTHQIVDSESHWHVSKEDAQELYWRITETFQNARKDIDTSENEVENTQTPEEETPESDITIPPWPTWIPENIQSLYNSELTEANKIGMSEEVINFVMQQEWSISLATDENDPIWTRSLWHLRDGKDGYSQGKKYIETPNEGMTIDPGFDLGQTNEAGLKALFSGIVTPQQLERLIALQKVVDKYEPQAEWDDVILKKLPKEFADIREMQLTPVQTKIMAIRLYKKHWEMWIKNIPWLQKNDVPTGVRAALASKFVHRGPLWLQDRLQSYVDGLDEGFRPKKSELQKGIDELQKKSPNWYLPQVIQLINLGIPLPKRSQKEQEKYLSWATPIQKEAYANWHKEATKAPEKLPGTLNQTIQGIVSGAREDKILPKTAIEKTAWSVYDLRDHKSLWDINENESMRAASMIKPFVVLAYLSLHPVPTPEEKEKLQFMIDYNPDKIEQKDWYKKLPAWSVYSKANALTTEIMKTIGTPEEILNTLKTKTINKGTSSIPLLPDSSTNGIHLEETIRTDGKTYKNTLTTKSIVEFYRHLYENRDIEPYATLLSFLKTPKRDSIADKTNIPWIYPVASKSGTTGLARCDGGIIFAKDPDGKAHPYIFVGMFSRSDGNPYKNYTKNSKERADISREISSQVYDAIFQTKK